MIALKVLRKSDTVIVVIMKNKLDKKYSFVNLTHPHICGCKFDTVENALDDLKNQMKIGNVVSCETISIKFLDESRGI